MLIHTHTHKILKIDPSKPSRKLTTFSKELAMVFIKSLTFFILLKQMCSTWSELWCKYCRLCSSKSCRGRQAAGSRQSCGTGSDVPILHWKCPYTFWAKVGKLLLLWQVYVHICMETILTRGRVQPGPPSCQPPYLRSGASFKTHAPNIDSGGRTWLDERSGHCLLRGATEG